MKPESIERAERRKRSKEGNSRPVGAPRRCDSLPSSQMRTHKRDARKEVLLRLKADADANGVSLHDIVKDEKDIKWLESFSRRSMMARVPTASVGASASCPGPFVGTSVSPAMCTSAARQFGREPLDHSPLLSSDDSQPGRNVLLGDSGTPTPLWSFGSRPGTSQSSSVTSFAVSDIVPPSPAAECVSRDVFGSMLSGVKECETHWRSRGQQNDCSNTELLRLFMKEQERRYMQRVYPQVIRAFPVHHGGINNGNVGPPPVLRLVQHVWPQQPVGQQNFNQLAPCPRFPLGSRILLVGGCSTGKTYAIASMLTNNLFVPRPQHVYLIRRVPQAIYNHMVANYPHTVFDDFRHFNYNTALQNSIVIIDDSIYEVQGSRVYTDMVKVARHNRLTIVTMSPRIYASGRFSKDQRELYTKICMFHTKWRHPPRLFTDIEDNLPFQTKMLNELVQRTPHSVLILDVDNERPYHVPCAVATMFPPVQ